MPLGGLAHRRALGFPRCACLPSDGGERGTLGAKAAQEDSLYAKVFFCQNQ